MTAVEWYAEEFAEHLEEMYGVKIKSLTLLSKAKKMEKQQIIDAYKDSTCQFSVDSRIDYLKSAEEYYNETFKDK